MVLASVSEEPAAPAALWISRSPTALSSSGRMAVSVPARHTATRTGALPRRLFAPSPQSGPRPSPDNPGSAPGPPPGSGSNRRAKSAPRDFLSPLLSTHSLPRQPACLYASPEGILGGRLQLHQGDAGHRGHRRRGEAAPKGRTLPLHNTPRGNTRPALRSSCCTKIPCRVTWASDEAVRVVPSVARGTSAACNKPRLGTSPSVPTIPPARGLRAMIL